MASPVKTQRQEREERRRRAAGSAETKRRASHRTSAAEAAYVSQSATSRFSAVSSSPDLSRESSSATADSGDLRPTVRSAAWPTRGNGSTAGGEGGDPRARSPRERAAAAAARRRDLVAGPLQHRLLLLLDLGDPGRQLRALARAPRGALRRDARRSASRASGSWAAASRSSARTRRRSSGAIGARGLADHRRHDERGAPDRARRARALRDGLRRDLRLAERRRTRSPTRAMMQTTRQELRPRRRERAARGGASSARPAPRRSLRVQFLVYQDNYRQLPEMYRVFRESGADRFWLNGLYPVRPMPMMSEEDIAEMLRALRGASSPQDYFERLERFSFWETLDRGPHRRVDAARLRAGAARAPRAGQAPPPLRRAEPREARGRRRACTSSAWSAGTR